MNKRNILCISCLALLCVTATGCRQASSSNQKEEAQSSKEEASNKQKEVSSSHKESNNQQKEKSSQKDTTLKINYMNYKSNQQNQMPGGGLGKSSINVQNVKTKYLDVEYNSKTKQTLDIYLPNSKRESYPVVFAIHGGAFMGGDSKGGDIAAQMQALNHGYAVVSINYRLSDQSTFPGAISDVKAAIRYIRKNAKKYHLDENKFITWGDSSGGNLATLAGATGGTNDLYDKSLGYTTVSDKVNAVVDYYGPINFGTMTEQMKKLNITPMLGYASDSTSPESKYLGETVTKNSKKVEQSNPTNYIKENGPFYFIAHGTSDKNVPYLQSVDFAKKIASIEGADKVNLTLIKGASHGGEAFESEALLNKVFQFLDQKLNITSINTDSQSKDYISISNQ